MKSKERRLFARIAFWTFFLVGLTFLLEFLGVIRFLPKSQFEGVYFRTDSPSLIEIREHSDGKLHLAQIWPVSGVDSWKVKTRWHTLILGMQISIPMAQVGSEDIELAYEYRFKKSANKGDWDLVANRDTPEWETAANGTPVWISKPLKNIENPELSCLHRVNGRLWIPYFEGIATHSEYSGVQPQPASELLAIATSILAESPDDRIARFVYCDALIRDNQFDELETRLAAWRNDFAQKESRFFEDRVAIADAALRARRLSAEGLNAEAVMTQMSDGSVGNSERFRILPAVLKFEAWEPQPDGIFQVNYPNFLEHQIFAKIASLESTYLLMRGERERALELASANYRVGQFLQAQDGSINALVGVAISAVAGTGIEYIILGACDTPEEFERVRNSLEELQSHQREFCLEDFAKAYTPSSATTPDRQEETIADHVVRTGVVNTRLQLLRAAAAARHSLLTAGSPPPTIESLDTLFDSNPPRDPFTGNRLLYKSTRNDMTLWSMGPDKADNSATITYDPTNGTVSAGDLILEIPEKPKYDFPRSGIDLQSEASIALAFPNGLPPDSFADTRGLPLTVHPGSPPIIFSFGPDTDQSAYVASLQGGEDYYSRYGHDQPQYDPTNGTVSRGNLYITPSGPTSETK